MTEHEKLLAGQEYDYRDEEIQKMLKDARKLVEIINTSQNIDDRQAAIKDLFNTTGKGLTLNGQFKALYGKHISFGDNDFVNNDCDFQDSNLISLGDRVIIGPDTKLYCGSHSLDATKRFGTRGNGEKYLISVTSPITIGDDVWIGGNVTIIGGVEIGSNVVIAAGAVVTKDIPDNSIVGGVPAHLIRELPVIK